MISPAIPKSEAARLNALNQYGIIGTKPEHCFDRITRLAAELFKAPIAVISFTDQNRQWVKSCVGLEVQEVPRELTFCAHALLDDTVLLVPDATRDARFSGNPFVTGESHVRFYAGAPLITADGFRLGTLCVIDTLTRSCTEEHKVRCLRDLADQVIDQLELARSQRTLAALKADLHRRGQALKCSEDEISGRRRAVEELENVRNLMQLAIENMPHRVFWKDINGIYLGCNRAYAADIGRSGPEEVIGKNDYELHSADNAERFRADDLQVIENGVGFRDLVRSRPRTDGTLGWFSSNKMPIRDHAGQIVGVMCTIDDITLQKESKEQLQKGKDAAESAARVKGDFLANMSHEIRTPLNGVLGMVSLLLDSPLNAEQRSCVRTAQSSGESLLSLLNCILDLSKAEAGKLSVEQVPFDLCNVVRQCSELLLPQANAKGLSLQTSIPTIFPARISGDPSRVRQIVLNYLANAIKFTSDGCITVVVSLPERGSSFFRIAVSDTGIGMAAEVQQRLFQAFTQGDSSTRRRFGGTGLGLFIVKQLSELMGGSVGHSSEEGKGSTFWVDLPFVPVQMREPAPIVESSIWKLATEGGSRRILLAEDNRVNQIIARKMLEKLGCEVQIACNGLEAVRMWKAAPFDLVFMDGQMPELDGYEATGAVRELEQKRELGRTPIVALTAHALPGDRELCIAAGMDDYVTKPIQLEELRRVLNAWLPATVPELVAV